MQPKLNPDKFLFPMFFQNSQPISRKSILKKPGTIFSQYCINKNQTFMELTSVNIFVSKQHMLEMKMDQWSGKRHWSKQTDTFKLESRVIFLSHKRVSLHSNYSIASTKLFIRNFI